MSKLGLRRVTPKVLRKCQTSDCFFIICIQRTYNSYVGITHYVLTMTYVQIRSYNLNSILCTTDGKYYNDFTHYMKML